MINKFSGYDPKKLGDPKLVEEWDKKLAEEGLGEIEGPQLVPEELVQRDFVAEPTGQFHDEMEQLLEKYESLPPKLKTDIIDELRKQKAGGMTYEQILDRLELLAEKGLVLQKMTSGDSDKKHKPKTTSPTPKKMSEQSIDDLIANMERLLNTGRGGDSIH